jgi:hypothetical protein
MRQICVAGLMLVVASGCATVKPVNISTTPPGASLTLDNRPIGQSPMLQRFSFVSADQAYTLSATKYGFETATVRVQRDQVGSTLELPLTPQKKAILVKVEPVAAQVSLDGINVSPMMSQSSRIELPFLPAEDGTALARIIRASRKGFVTAEQSIDWDSLQPTYTLTLKPVTKTLTITTDPPGAALELDGQAIGTSPVTLPDQAFAIDTQNDRWIGQKLIARKAGFEPTQAEIAWDEGRQAYSYELGVKRKRVQITLEPPDASVVLDGKPLQVDEEGRATGELVFKPIDEKGTLPSFVAIANVKREGEQWHPSEIKIAYDEGASDYTIRLKEILERPVSQQSVQFVRENGRWQPKLLTQETIGYKPSDIDAAVRVTNFPAGTQLGELAVSPDGKKLVVVQLQASGDEPRSRLASINLEGGQVTYLTDGTTLELTPSFSPAGDRLLFSSNRGGGMAIWSMPLDKAGGVTRLTTGAGLQLSPSLDSDPQPKLYYQAMIDARSEPRLYSTTLGTVFETDLTANSGSHPEISPDNERLAFVGGGEIPELCTIPAAGGAATTITNTPELSEQSPAWSSDGSKLFYTVSKVEENILRSDICRIDADGKNLLPLTMDPGIDDHPVPSPAGDVVYFRSNRGGKWDVWKVAVKE